MFERQPELASDLTWLLRGEQKSPATLARALIDAYGVEIYRLCLALLGDEPKARRALHLTLVSALLDAPFFGTSQSAWQDDRFAPGMPGGPQPPGTLEDRKQTQEERGVRLWLIFHALNVARRIRSLRQMPARRLDQLFRPVAPQSVIAWRAWEKQPRQGRLALLLIYLAECTYAETAALLGINEGKLHSLLERFHVAAGADGLHQDSHRRMPADQAGQWLAVEFPTSSFSSQELQGLSEAVIKQAGAKSGRGRQIAAISEALLVGVAILVAGGLVWGINQAIPEPDPTKPIVYQTVLVTSTPPLALAAARRLQREHSVVPSRLSTSLDLFFYTVQPGDTLGSIARKYGFFKPQDLFNLNRLAPASVLSPGKKLLLPTRIMQFGYYRVTPVDPQSPNTLDAFEIGGRASNLPELYRRYRWITSNWQTLWVDAVFNDYVPGSSTKPARSIRLQAWLSGNQLLALLGPPDGMPQEVHLAWFDENRYYFARPQGDFTWFAEQEFLKLQTQPVIQNYLTALLNPFFPAAPRGSRSFELAGVGEHLGVEAEMINVYNSIGQLSRQLSVDREGGLILHSLEYNQPGEENLAREILVQDWQYDMNLPQFLLDPRLPWRGGYASDPSGDATDPGR